MFFPALPALATATPGLAVAPPAQHPRFATLTVAARRRRHRTTSNSTGAPPHGTAGTPLPPRRAQPETRAAAAKPTPAPAPPQAQPCLPPRTRHSPRPDPGVAAPHPHRDRRGADHPRDADRPRDGVDEPPPSVPSQASPAGAPPPRRPAVHPTRAARRSTALQRSRPGAQPAPRRDPGRTALPTTRPTTVSRTVAVLTLLGTPHLATPAITGLSVWIALVVHGHWSAGAAVGPIPGHAAGPALPAQAFSQTVGLLALGYSWWATVLSLVAASRPLWARQPSPERLAAAHRSATTCVIVLATVHAGVGALAPLSATVASQVGPAIAIGILALCLAIALAAVSRLPARIRAGGGGAVRLLTATAYLFGLWHAIGAGSDLQPGALGWILIWMAQPILIYLWLRRWTQPATPSYAAADTGRRPRPSRAALPRTRASVAAAPGHRTATSTLAAAPVAAAPEASLSIHLRRLDAALAAQPVAEPAPGISSSPSAVVAAAPTVQAPRDRSPAPVRAATVATGPAALPTHLRRLDAAAAFEHPSMRLRDEPTTSAAETHRR